MNYFGQLRIFTSSAVGLEHLNLEDSGKVLLPPSVLAELTHFSGDTPMLFCLSNTVTEVMTHCGVLEFSAEEGSVIAPSWAIDQIGVVCGDLVYVESIYLPVGSYAKFKPLSANFLDITNQKAVLENKLRNFSCLTCGDIIPIEYNNTTYLLKVVTTRPGDAVCIVNCDLEVEFECPVGYKPPSVQQKIPDIQNSEASDTNIASFSGTGYRLDGKKVEYSQSLGSTPKPRGIPDYDWTFGTLNFFHNYQSSSPVQESPSPKDESPFPGTGRSLK